MQQTEVEQWLTKNYPFKAGDPFPILFSSDAVRALFAVSEKYEIPIPIGARVSAKWLNQIAERVLNDSV